MEDAGVETFSTATVAPGRRLEFWNQVAASTFGAMEVVGDRHTLSARLCRRRYGAMMLAEVVSSPARVRGLTGGGVPEANGWFILLNEASHSRMSQRGHEVLLAPGELTVLYSHEPFDIAFATPNRTLVLHLPNTPHHVDIERHAFQRHTVADSALLIALMRRLAAGQTEPRTQRQATLSIGPLVRDLLQLSWPVANVESTRRSPDWWCRQIRQVVERRLGDPRLGVDTIARECGISKRYVHMLFARIGETAEHYILNQRLDVAERSLAHSPDARITEIAFELGFKELSHFCRAFRRRFGMTAGAHRARARSL